MRRVPWIAASVPLVALGLWAAGQLAPVAGLMPGCFFKRATGLACATCGLTRCLLALGRGQWGAAVHWHPAAVALLALVPIAGLWDLRRAWRGTPYPPLPDSGALRLALWLILVGTWALQVARGI